MKNLNFLKPLFLFVFLGLCSTACNDDDGHIPMPEPEGPGCKLVKSSSTLYYDDAYTTYEYNAQGYVILRRGVSIDSNTYSETKFFYDENNLAVNAKNYQKYPTGEYVLQSYYYYNYNDNGLLTDITEVYPNGSDGGGVYYEYDSKGRLINVGDYSVYLIYTYDNNDNVIKSEVINGYTSTYEDYDDNPTPYSAIKGLPTTGHFGNNPRKEIRTRGRNEKEVITYTYTYNSSGYPTKIVETDRLDVHVKTFAYQCK